MGQLEAQVLDAKDHIFIMGFLHVLKMARDNNDVHEAAAILLFSHS